MKQNITLAIEQEILRKARVLAAERRTSLSRLLSEELVRMVEVADTYTRAKEQALKDLDKGFHLGGRPAKRDALHER